MGQTNAGAETVPAIRKPAYQAILDAGLASFAATGFYGASVREIARGAGTSLSNLYNYFPSKEDLLVAVLKDANHMLCTQVEDAIAGARDVATQQSLAAVNAFVRFAVKHQAASLIAITEVRYLTGEKRHALVAQRDKTQRLLEHVVQAGIDTGEFSTASAKDATRAIISMCMTISSWYRPDGPYTLAELEKLYRAYALGVLRTAVT